MNPGGAGSIRLDRFAADHGLPFIKELGFANLCPILSVLREAFTGRSTTGDENGTSNRELP